MMRTQIRMRYPTQRLRSGVVIAEVLVGIGILSLILIAMVYASGQFMNAGRVITEKSQAIFLAEEGIEIARFMRDAEWSHLSALTTGTSYAFSIGTSTVSIVTAPEVVDIFSRTFAVTPVYRNTVTRDIIASTTSGAALDTGSKYVTVTVAWGSPTTSVALTTLLTDFDL